jgi:hypothetical protein
MSFSLADIDYSRRGKKFRLTVPMGEWQGIGAILHQYKDTVCFVCIDPLHGSFCYCSTDQMEMIPE